MSGQGNVNQHEHAWIYLSPPVVAHGDILRRITKLGIEHVSVSESVMLEDIGVLILCSNLPQSWANAEGKSCCHLHFCPPNAYNYNIIRVVRQFTFAAEDDDEADLVPVKTEASVGIREPTSSEI